MEHELLRVKSPIAQVSLSNSIWGINREQPNKCIVRFVKHHHVLWTHAPMDHALH